MLTFPPEPFYNRIYELAALDRAWKQRGRGGQMMLLYGRRRLGKTYLLQRYFTGGVTGTEAPKPHCYYLAEQTTATAQRLTLARQLLDALPSEGITAEEIAISWNALLRYAAREARQWADSGRFGLILDEFPYLVEQTPALPSILQAWWDREGIHSPLYLVLCGSQLSAMAALGVESAPLFGRFNAGIHRLDPLSYADVAAFYDDSPYYGVAEKLLMYGILGGAPRYHALVDPAQPLADEVIALLLQPRAVLENEVRFLLSSEQIREPAIYNAVLAAIAAGETQFGRIQQALGTDKGTLSFYLKTLQELSWIRRELPFGDTTDRRTLYRIADPFLAFWYRFIGPLTSVLPFSDPNQVFQDRIAPYLADYMGWSVFEDICAQWLQRHSQERLGLSLRQIGRYWSRNGQIEIDLMGQLVNGGYVFGECKWSANSPIGLGVYSSLRAKMAGLPDAGWRDAPTCLLFSVGGFTPDLTALASNPDESLHLISGNDLLV